MSDRKPVYYITTSIPYVNARPHVGHALEYVQTDAYARFNRQQGKDVRFLSGSDENSLKNVQAAEAEGISTLELVNRNVVFFEEAMQLLGCSHDDFIRTGVEERHFEGAAKLWKAMDAAGDVYKKQYTGL
jgi:methionyl-tRNA synthetase